MRKLALLFDGKESIIDTYNKILQDRDNPLSKLLYSFKDMLKFDIDVFELDTVMSVHHKHKTILNKDIILIYKGNCYLDGIANQSSYTMKYGNDKLSHSTEPLIDYTIETDVNDTENFLYEVFYAFLHRLYGSIKYPAEDLSIYEKQVLLNKLKRYFTKKRNGNINNSKSSNFYIAINPAIKDINVIDYSFDDAFFVEEASPLKGLSESLSEFFKKAIPTYRKIDPIPYFGDTESFNIFTDVHKLQSDWVLYVGSATNDTSFIENVIYGMKFYFKNDIMAISKV